MIPDIESIFLISVFCCWFFLSIFKQLSPRLQPDWYSRVSGLDIFSLLPIWTFFAPNPGRFDYRILIKNKYADNTEGEWEEIDLIQKRSVVSAVWNPHKRLTKAVCDAVQEIALSREANGQIYEKTYFIHLPHLFFLNLVLNYQRDSNVVERKYVVIATHGFEIENNFQIIAKSEYFGVS